MLGGLGLAACAPAAAMADIVSKVGYKEDGAAYEGLVTVEGKTYLYEGGVKFTGGRKEYKGARYFYKSDGHMAVSETVEWDDGTEHEYGSDGVLAEDEADLGDEADESGFTAGWYSLTCAKSSRRLDVPGNATANGTSIDVADANHQQGQKWRIMWDASVKAFRIETSAAVMESPKEGLTDAGQKVVLWADCWKENGTAYKNQRWKLAKDKQGRYLITNADSGLALTAKKSDDGTPVTLQKVTGKDNQKWELKATPSWEGWWTDPSGNHHVNNPADGMMVKSTKMADPAYTNGEGVDDGWGSIYDFDGDGTASWHLPTYDDLPNGGAHGPDAAVPSITQGDRRQRTIMYGLSRVGCEYVDNTAGPTTFVCDSLTSWAYRMGTGEVFTTSDNPEFWDASFQWALIKERDGDPWQRDQGSLKPGDMVYFGQEALTWYGGAFGVEGYGTYHAAMYYAGGRMINARGVIGVTKDTLVAEYPTEGADTDDGSSGMGMAYLGGGSPYAWDTSVTGVPHM